jgi:hypothetical protein
MISYEVQLSVLRVVGGVIEKRWQKLLKERCLNDMTTWFMTFGAKSTNPVVWTDIQKILALSFHITGHQAPNLGLFSSRNRAGRLPL